MPKALLFISAFTTSRAWAYLSTSTSSSIRQNQVLGSCNTNCVTATVSSVNTDVGISNMLQASPTVYRTNAKSTTCTLRKAILIGRKPPRKFQGLSHTGHPELVHSHDHTLDPEAQQHTQNIVWPMRPAILQPKKIMENKNNLKSRLCREAKIPDTALAKGRQAPASATYFSHSRTSGLRNRGPNQELWPMIV
jgi:hypothetical protein